MTTANLLIKVAVFLDHHDTHIITFSTRNEGICTFLADKITLKNQEIWNSKNSLKFALFYDI